MDKIMEESIEIYEYCIEYTKIPFAQIKNFNLGILKKEDINFFSAEERYATYEKAKEIFDNYRKNENFYEVVLKRIDKDENNNILNTFELESWKKEN